MKYIDRNCKKHGFTSFVLEGRGYYRCKKCRSEAVQKRRDLVKQKLVEHFGGACQGCGYSKYIGSLQFHHRDPSKKDFDLSDKGHTISFDKALAEAEKCVLVCANCHGEIHAGIRECPK